MSVEVLIRPLSSLTVMERVVRWRRARRRQEEQLLKEEVVTQLCKCWVSCPPSFASTCAPLSSATCRPVSRHTHTHTHTHLLKGEKTIYLSVCVCVQYITLPLLFDPILYSVYIDLDLV